MGEKAKISMVCLLTAVQFTTKIDCGISRVDWTTWCYLTSWKQDPYALPSVSVSLMRRLLASKKAGRAAERFDI